MSSPSEEPRTSSADTPPFPRIPWLTQRRLIFFVIAWVSLFAVISVFVSNPFISHVSSLAPPNYARVMFMHGLLIGMTGLLALLVVQVLSLQSEHVRTWVTAGVLAGTLLATVGGIFNRQMPGSEIALWVQVLSFFLLDEIALALLIAMLQDFRKRAPIARTLPFVAAFFAGLSMFGAAVMGHLAGWIVEFKNFPRIIGQYAQFVGFVEIDDFFQALLYSHSREMTVGVMAVGAALLAHQYGYKTLKGAGLLLGRIGVTMVAVGSFVMTGMYVAMGFTTWEAPVVFRRGPGGPGGLMADNLVTGVLVMGGGLITIVALLLGRQIRRPVRLASAWSWVLSFITVAAAGYFIGEHEPLFSGGAATEGPTPNEIYIWFHEDIGLFMLPMLILIMLAVERFLERGRPNWIGWTIIVGISVVVAGGGVWVFIDPALYGPGYDVSTAGIVIVALAILATLWWSWRTVTGPPTTGAETRQGGH
jgi:hypothetical protein